MKEQLEEKKTGEKLASSDQTFEKVQVKDDSLSQEHALNILVQAVRLANKRGAYELEETELILKAVKVFTIQKV